MKYFKLLNFFNDYNDLNSHIKVIHLYSLISSNNMLSSRNINSRTNDYEQSYESPIIRKVTKEIIAN